MIVLWSSMTDFRSNIVIPRYPMIETLLSAGSMYWPLLGGRWKDLGFHFWNEMTVNNKICAFPFSRCFCWVCGR